MCYVICIVEQRQHSSLSKPLIIKKNLTPQLNLTYPPGPTVQACIISPDKSNDTLDRVWGQWMLSELILDISELSVAFRSSMEPCWSFNLLGKSGPALFSSRHLYVHLLGFSYA